MVLIIWLNYHRKPNPNNMFGLCVLCFIVISFVQNILGRRAMIIMMNGMVLL